jgi:hypothetical protein
MQSLHGERERQAIAEDTAQLDLSIQNSKESSPSGKPHDFPAFLIGSNSTQQNGRVTDKWAMLSHHYLAYAVGKQILTTALFNQLQQQRAEGQTMSSSLVS